MDLENNVSKEQPLVSDSDQVLTNDLEQNLENQSTSQSGSLLGKFKDVESLMEAYNNLQKEFTRKSQKLSELTKQDNKSTNIMQSAGDLENQTGGEQSNLSTMQTNENVEMLQKNSENDAQNSEESVQTANLVDNPEYNLENWSEKVSEFLRSNAYAKTYAKDIAMLLSSDKVLASMPNSLELAYAKVLAKNFRTDEERIGDQEFVEKYVLTNENIKQSIIKQYLNTIKNNSAPTLIANSLGSAHVGLTPQQKPKDLQEASKIVERMMKQK